MQAEDLAILERITNQISSATNLLTPVWNSWMSKVAELAGGARSAQPQLAAAASSLTNGGGGTTQKTQENDSKQQLAARRDADPAQALRTAAAAGSADLLSLATNLATSGSMSVNITNAGVQSGAALARASAGSDPKARSAALSEALVDTVDAAEQAAMFVQAGLAAGQTGTQDLPASAAANPSAAAVTVPGGSSSASGRNSPPYSDWPRKSVTQPARSDATRAGLSPTVADQLRWEQRSARSGGRPAAPSGGTGADGKPSASSGGAAGVQSGSGDGVRLGHLIPERTEAQQAAAKAKVVEALNKAQAAAEEAAAMTVSLMAAVEHADKVGAWPTSSPILSLRTVIAKRMEAVARLTQAKAQAPAKREDAMHALGAHPDDVSGKS